MNQHEALAIANRDEIIARYKRLRSAGQKLCNQMVKTLSKEVLYEGGSQLGMYRNGALFFNNEDETCVLMDYCIYDVRQKGRNAVEQYLINSPPDPDSDAMAYLLSMQHAIYSFFIVESVERGLGVRVQDAFSNETLLVVDMGFGSTAKPGLLFATRLLPHEQFFMTSGAALPIGVLPAAQRSALTKELAAAAAPDADGYFDPAPLIRSCLAAGCSSHIKYQDPSGRLVSEPHGSGSIVSGRIGRNSPCPCGSGKKFKQCCAKRS